MKIINTKPNPEAVAGFWDIKTPDNFKLESGDSSVIFNTPEILSIDDLLSQNSCDNLIKLFRESNIFEHVSVNGLKTENLGKGSHRATGYSEELATQLSELIIPYLSDLHCDDFTSTDFWQFSVSNDWKPIGISPMLRFMQYDNESEHFAHYDAGFIYPNTIHRTLKSFVLYLTTNEIGATRFIDDDQEDIAVWDRNHDDWNRRVNDNEILLESFPVKGKILIFNHRLCHDVEQYFPTTENECRIIIRGDVIYEAKD